MLFGAALSSEHSKWIAARKLPASNLLVIAAVRRESSFFRCFDRVGRRGGIHCDVGLSLQALSLLMTTLARFLVAHALAGLASIAGAKEKRLSHASRSIGLDIILWRILRRTTAHAARTALGTLVMSGVQGGSCSLADGSPWMSSGGWLTGMS